MAFALLIEPSVVEGPPLRNLHLAIEAQVVHLHELLHITRVIRVRRVVLVEEMTGNAWAIAAGGDTELFARGDNALFATDSIGSSWAQETTSGNVTAITIG